MAIDTRDKRGSIISVLPDPNSLIDQGDRQQLIPLYRGIAPEDTSSSSGAVRIKSITTQPAIGIEIGIST